MKKHTLHIIGVMLAAVLLGCACSTTKRLADGEVL